MCDFNKNLSSQAKLRDLFPRLFVLALTNFMKLYHFGKIILQIKQIFSMPRASLSISLTYLKLASISELPPVQESPAEFTHLFFLFGIIFELRALTREKISSD